MGYYLFLTVRNIVSMYIHVPFLHEHVFSSVLEKYPGMEWLDHIRVVKVNEKFLLWEPEHEFKKFFDSK